MRQDASTGQLVEDGVQSVSDTPKIEGDKLLHVKVYSPFRTYFDDTARSLSAINLTGPFDILVDHHKFISLLEPCEIALDTDSGAQRIKIAGGIMHVRNNEVSILLDV